MDETPPKVTAEDAKAALSVANDMVKKIMERQAEIDKLMQENSKTSDNKGF
jgi:predicted ATP-grasp superfamily ATP-dependent carboligase